MPSGGGFLNLSGQRMAQERSKAEQTSNEHCGIDEERTESENKQTSRERSAAGLNDNEGTSSAARMEATESIHHPSNVAKRDNCGDEASDNNGEERRTLEEKCRTERRQARHKSVGGDTDEQKVDRHDNQDDPPRRRSVDSALVSDNNHGSHRRAHDAAGDSRTASVGMALWIRLRKQGLNNLKDARAAEVTAENKYRILHEAKDFFCRALLACPDDDDARRELRTYVATTMSNLRLWGEICELLTLPEYGSMDEKSMQVNLYRRATALVSTASRSIERRVQPRAAPADAFTTLCCADKDEEEQINKALKVARHLYPDLTLDGEELLLHAAHQDFENSLNLDPTRKDCRNGLTTTAFLIEETLKEARCADQIPGAEPDDHQKEQKEPEFFFDSTTYR
eukprot:GEMP01049081.1.p1 GENE.GEMP01049081.1~~GEMP01049081.1.p1  ORF type:complete len:397 (+),score=100.62 GEMP01049081.1:94-1284(+)